MMMGLNGRAPEDDTDVFAYTLALRLGKTVAELDQMPQHEYHAWAAYFTAKHASENLTAVAP